MLLTNAPIGDDLRGNARAVAETATGAVQVAFPDRSGYRGIPQSSPASPTVVSAITRLSRSSGAPQRRVACRHRQQDRVLVARRQSGGASICADQGLPRRSQSSGEPSHGRSDRTARGRKTTIARVIALGYASQGWQVFECRGPLDFLRGSPSEAKQRFVADDAFGSTEYRPDIAQQWADEIEAILNGIDSSHRLIWTSRSAVLKAALAGMAPKGAAETWPKPDEIEVKADSLTEEEKALMVYRHCKAAELPLASRELVRVNAHVIVADEKFTPERIARFVRSRLPSIAKLPVQERQHAFRRAASEEMRQPTKSMRLAFEALDREDQRLLISMLDAARSSVTMQELSPAFQRQGGTSSVTALVELLSGHFIRRQDGGELWLHPSWRDLVIERLAADAQRRTDFLTRCGVEGLLLALSTRGQPR